MVQCNIGERVELRKLLEMSGVAIEKGKRDEADHNRMMMAILEREGRHEYVDAKTWMWVRWTWEMILKSDG